MAEFQELTKALNDNSVCLARTAQGMESHSQALVECTRKIADEVGNLELGDREPRDKIVGTGHIKVFDGNTKQYESWVKEIEKAAFLSRLNDQKIQLLAYQYSTGFVSDYIKRYLESGERTSWNELKVNLASRFSSAIDGPKAFEILLGIRQRPDEPVTFYAERLLDAAKTAYPHQTEHTRPIIESQLLSIFLSGIWDREIRAQVERCAPKTFDEAYTLALREQQINSRCVPRRNRPERNSHFGNHAARDGHSPMEVDHLRRGHYYNGNQGDEYRYRRQVNDRRNDRWTETRPRLGSNDRRNDRRTERRPQLGNRRSVNSIGRIQCWGCSEMGHKQVNCPKHLN